MKLVIHASVSRSFPILSRLQLTNAGLRSFAVSFLAFLRAKYEARKQKGIPMDKKYRQFSIGYFMLAFLMMLMIQNYLGRPHVEIISYSEFKTLLKKSLITDLAIHETTIDGNLKGAAAKEILTPEK